MSFMQTFTGRKFWPMEPLPGDIDIRDIAHALANTCRYAGHCLVFYSVAEHSVLMSEKASPKNRLAALLHDAAEAYLCDVPSPLKPYLTNYQAIEQRLNECVAERFGIPFPFPDEIHALDSAILADERAQLMAPMTDVENKEWGAPLPPLGVEFPKWPPAIAERQFLRAFHALNVDNGDHR
jgi:hypothetical protein